MRTTFLPCASLAKQLKKGGKHGIGELLGGCQRNNLYYHKKAPNFEQVPSLKLTANFAPENQWKIRCPFASKGRLFQRQNCCWFQGWWSARYFKKPFNFFLGLGGSKCCCLCSSRILGEDDFLRNFESGRRSHMFQMGGEKPTPPEAFGVPFSNDCLIAPRL